LTQRSHRVAVTSMTAPTVGGAAGDHSCSIVGPVSAHCWPHAAAQKRFAA
jgi:hypothetical protein